MRSKLIHSLIALLIPAALLAHVQFTIDLEGKIFEEGEILEISWEIVIEHDQNNWDLMFSSDGGENWIPLAEDLPVEKLSYSWLIPGIQTTQAQLMIVQDNNGNNYTAKSGIFYLNEQPSALPVNNSHSVKATGVKVYPQPVIQQVNFELQLTQAAEVNIALFSLTGSKLVTVFNGELGEGTNTISWSPEIKLPRSAIYRIMIGQQELSGILLSP